MTILRLAILLVLPALLLAVCSKDEPAGSQPDPFQETATRTASELSRIEVEAKALLDRAAIDPALVATADFQRSLGLLAGQTSALAQEWTQLKAPAHMTNYYTRVNEYLTLVASKLTLYRDGFATADAAKLAQAARLNEDSKLKLEEVRRAAGAPTPVPGSSAADQYRTAIKTLSDEVGAQVTELHRLLGEPVPDSEEWRGSVGGQLAKLSQALSKAQSLPVASAYVKYNDGFLRYLTLLRDCYAALYEGSLTGDQAVVELAISLSEQAETERLAVLETAKQLGWY